MRMLGLNVEEFLQVFIEGMDRDEGVEFHVLYICRYSPKE